MALSHDSYTVIENPSLAERTSIRLGGEAIAEVRLHSIEGIEQLPGLLARIGGQVRMIGEGTNIIAASGRLPFVLLAYDSRSEPMVVDDKEDSVLVRVEAGMRLPAFLSWCARHGLRGLEALAGIPGSVGGAIAMNAGSYGIETGDAIRSVQIFSSATGLVEREAEDFDFSYRRCGLRGNSSDFLITAATFVLERGNGDDGRAKIREVYLKKQSSQPVSAKSAGCIFKNPAPDAPAGKLLDETGLKGHGVGGMYFSTQHANFMINGGSGTYEQAMELVELAQEKVRERTGLQLELEVRIWR